VKYRIEVRHNARRWWWVLLHMNGRVLATSELYGENNPLRKRAKWNCLATVKRLSAATGFPFTIVDRKEGGKKK